MTWFRVDDGLADHPKVLACSLAAMGLWVKAGAWCGKHLTDGKLPRGVVQLLGATTKHAGELVRAGLWEQTEDGYAFCGWLERNPSRADVENERAEARERMRALRGNKPRRSPERSPEQAENFSSSFATPVPSRPVPTQPAPADAGAAECASSPPPVLRSLSSHDAAAAWSRAIGQYNPGAMHAHAQWRADFETIAAACNAEAKPAEALERLHAWWWTDREGPIRSGRVKLAFANPKQLAKHVSADLARAMGRSKGEPPPAAEPGKSPAALAYESAVRAIEQAQAQGKDREHPDMQPLIERLRTAERDWEAETQKRGHAA